MLPANKFISTPVLPVPVPNARFFASGMIFAEPHLFPEIAGLPASTVFVQMWHYIFQIIFKNQSYAK